MHGLIWFPPDFLNWPWSVARRIQERHPDSRFSGLVSGPARDLEQLRQSTTPPIAPLYPLDQLLRGWLTNPVDAGRVAHYEALLGGDAINRIIIADRQLGRGFVYGAVMPETPLMRQTRNHEARLRCVVGMLDFLFEVFEENRPDFVFAPGVAGAVAMALAMTCEHFGVPFRRLLWTRIGPYNGITDSPLDGNRWIARLYNDACYDPSALADGALDKARALLADFAEQRDTLRDTAHSWRQSRNPLRPIDLAALAWRGITARPPEILNYPYPFAHLGWEIGRRLRRWYMAHFSDFVTARALAGKRYTFFPLQVTPEASTMVLTPMLTDQIAVVEALAKSLPGDMYLAVKEHVPMIGRRPLGFYRRLAAIPKVILVSPSENAYALIEGAALVCVITGTAGWEAMLLKRPLLCLGEALYQIVGQGFTRCDELGHLPAAIGTAMAAAPASDERLALFVAAVVSQSFVLPKRLRFGQTAETVAANPGITEAMADHLLASLPALTPVVR